MTGGWALRCRPRGEICWPVEGSVVVVIARLIEVGLQIAAALTAPLMGDFILDRGQPWGRIILDYLIGSAVFVGGTCAIGILFGFCFCCCTLAGIVSKDALPAAAGGAAANRA